MSTVIDIVEYCPDWNLEFQKVAALVRAGLGNAANIHVRQSGRPNQRYALLFRDYLVVHPLAAVAYGELKRRLAALVDSEDAYRAGSVCSAQAFGGQARDRGKGVDKAKTVNAIDLFRRYVPPNK